MTKEFRHRSRLALGWLLTVAGALMLVLPGPGLFALIPGLILLAPDVPWARRLLQKARQHAGR